MKKSIYTLILFGALAFCANAQTDSRNRTKETIIQDGLAQLPTQSPKSYNQLMGEMASTGEDGILMLAKMLVPANKGKNATFEYAIDGITSYVSDPKNKKLKDSVLKGLIAGFNQCSDNANKAFLLSEIKKIATTEQTDFLADLLTDKYLREHALNALASIKGNENAIKQLILTNKTDKQGLAYLAFAKKIKGIDDTLIAWEKDADTGTLANIYNALAISATPEAIANLFEAAKAKGFTDDATYATHSLVNALNNTNAQSIDKSIIKEMNNSKSSYIRCAALKVTLATDPAQASKNILQALKDPCAEYRHTALVNSSYAGSGIYDLVTSKKFGIPATTDIVRWLGNNHVSSQINYVIANIKQTKCPNLSKAGIEAAGKIGGTKALQALMEQLGGNFAEESQKALLSFNGNINEDITKVLNSSNSLAVKQALAIASQRRICKSYAKVKELASSTNIEIKAEALKALSGVATADNFNELCNMMESANAADQTALQNAAKVSIKNLSKEEQYNMVSSKMSKASNGSLYYPLLAQAGNNSAIDKLQADYNSGTNKDAAYKALLQVENTDMIPVLYNMAKSNAEKKNEVLARYLTLVRKSNKNSEQKYLLYRQALELNPSSNAVKRNTLTYLADCKSLLAMVTASNYLNDSETAMKAATAVKTIAAKQTDLLKGSVVKDLLSKSMEVFKAQTNNADAGYAVDEINGTLLPKINAKGYEKAIINKNADKIQITNNKNYENFELVVDWKSKGNSSLIVRSMPQVNLGADEVCVNGNSKTTASNKNDWNTLYIKVVNDRILVENNGVKVVSNFIMKNTPETSPINEKGLLEFIANDLEIRDCYICELPSTPIYELSAEEKKAGFELLFDGRSLDKWQGNLTDYVPVDGDIFVSAKYGGSGNLYTKKKYSDFVYRFEFNFVEPGVNNGIGIRTNIGTDAAYDGMEIQVLDHDAPIYKGLHDYQQHGAVYGIIVPKRVKFGKTGTWNTEEIRAVGDHITVTVNGEVILDGNIREACQGHNVAPDNSKTNPYTVDHKNHPGLFNPEGYISFCGHGAGVKFRNVRILDLSQKANTKAKKKNKK